MNDESLFGMLLATLIIVSTVAAVYLFDIAARIVIRKRDRFEENLHFVLARTDHQLALVLREIAHLHTRLQEIDNKIPVNIVTKAAAEPELRQRKK